MTENSTFVVPEPIMTQLSVIGTTQTTTRERLFPEFPSLPIEEINGHGGYYGRISEQNHNLYEELPCLGVTSEALRASISNAAPGPYPSALAGEGVAPKFRRRTTK